MEQPEIVELDCRRFWRSRKPLPQEVIEELHRCDSIWVPHPQIPRTPRSTLEWVWGWRGWKWRDGPSIPPQAKFTETVEVYGSDGGLETLKQQASEEMVRRMAAKLEGMGLGVFLCLNEKYTQGLLVEDSGSGAELRKVFVLVGKRSADHGEEGSWDSGAGGPR